MSIKRRIITTINVHSKRITDALYIEPIFPVPATTSLLKRYSVKAGGIFIVYPENNGSQ